MSQVASSWVELCRIEGAVRAVYTREKRRAGTSGLLDVRERLVALSLVLSLVLSTSYNSTMVFDA